MKYTARNLSELAELFMLNSQSSKEQKSRAKTQKEKNEHHARCDVWESAADILRRTILVDENGRER